MKRLCISFLLLGFCFIAKSQNQITATHNVPTYADLCNVNTGFNSTFSRVGAGGWGPNSILTLKIFVVESLPPTSPYNPVAINNPWVGPDPGPFPPCNLNESNKFPIDIRDVGIVSCASSAQPQIIDNAISFTWNVSNCSQNTIEIAYSVYLDCSIKSLNNGNVYLIQQWYLNNVPLPVQSQPASPTIVRAFHITPVLPPNQPQYWA